MSHECDAVITRCIDFRFEKYIHEWTEKNLKDKKFDTIAWAGSTKNLALVMEQIDISVRLHHPKQAILIHHEECGAYGAESTPERHAEDLNKAKDAILTKYPSLQVDMYYLKLDGEFVKV